MVGARHPDDPQVMGQQTVKFEEIEGRQQHPQGQIARAAEQHQHLAAGLAAFVFLSQCLPPYDNVVMTCPRQKGKRPGNASLATGHTWEFGRP